jgi:hypothetical protein
VLWTCFVIQRADALLRTYLDGVLAQCGVFLDSFLHYCGVGKLEERNTQDLGHVRGEPVCVDGG